MVYECEHCGYITNRQSNFLRHQNLVFSLTKVLKDKKNKYEIIFVDDDSKDGSADLFKKIKNKKIRFLIRKEKPRDLSKSVVYGFARSKYENLIVMDGDLQHHPSDLCKLMTKFQKNDCDNNLYYDIILRKLSLLFPYITNHVFTKYLQSKQNNMFQKIINSIYKRDFYNS